MLQYLFLGCVSHHGQKNITCSTRVTRFDSRSLGSKYGSYLGLLLPIVPPNLQHCIIYQIGTLLVHYILNGHSSNATFWIMWVHHGFIQGPLDYSQASYLGLLPPTPPHSPSIGNNVFKKMNIYTIKLEPFLVHPVPNGCSPKMLLGVGLDEDLHPPGMGCNSQCDC
jgi:hypothetical protein